MKFTAPQQKYFAYWLTKSLPPNDLGKWAASSHDARADITSYQTDAEIFDLKSSLSKGTILVNDEVELAKSLRQVLFRSFWGAWIQNKEERLSKVEAMLSQKIEQTKLITFHWNIV